MFCAKCGNQYNKDAYFCRSCGADLSKTALAFVEKNSLHKEKYNAVLTKANSPDPDELTGNGIGKVIIGDGFFIVSVLLSALQNSANSLLWLFLLIPAFFFFGKGLSDVLHARQIRRRHEREQLQAAPERAAQLSPAPVIEHIKKSISGGLVAMPSVNEKTTNKLKI